MSDGTAGGRLAGERLAGGRLAGERLADGTAGEMQPDGTLRIVGTLDPHVHLRGMEWSHKGTFATETAAALAGGFTAVLDMPNTPPATVDAPSLKRKLGDMAEQSLCDYGVWLGADPTGLMPADEMQHLARQVCGLKLYCGETTGGLLIDEDLMEQYVEAWPGPGPIGLHAEGDMIKAFLDAVARQGKRGHICHIPTADAVKHLAEAKQAGVAATAGVSPHHLFLTDRDLDSLGPLAVMKPPLGKGADKDALWEGLRNGVIDMVETDHAPHTWEEKQQNRPAFGVSGLETCLPLLCTAADAGWIAYEQLPELVADAPRRVFGVPPAGADTYTLIDTKARWTLDAAEMQTDCGWSPFDGMEVRGRVMEVVIRGEVAFADGEVLAKPGDGVDLYAG